MTTPTSRGDLGDEIRRRRKERNLTQEDLAKLAAVATSNVGKLERGKAVSPTTLRAVARALGLPARLTDPFLSERSSDPTQSTGLSHDERVLIRVLRHKGWPAEDIADAVDEFRRSNAVLPTVETTRDQPTETDRQRNEISRRQTGETGTQ